MAGALQVTVGVAYCGLWLITRALYYLLKSAGWLRDQMKRAYEDLREW